MIVGIDIGGTKTRLRAEDHGAVTFDVTTATDDWRGRLDGARDVEALVAILRGQVDVSRIDAMVVGAHGCDTDDDCHALQERLAFLLPAPISVLNDSELVPPAAGKQGGISVICGTGSIAVTRDAGRRMIAAGGWGWYLGDEGSASGLVREAVRAIRGDIDRGGRGDPMADLLVAAVGVTSPVELGRALSDSRSAARIGSFAPVVFEALAAGSALAEKVVLDGGKGLALLVRRLLDRGATGPDVVTGGGVITQQPRLFEAFGAALKTAAPGLRLTLLTEAPVLGATALARALGTGRWPSSLPLPHRNGRISDHTDWNAA